MVRTSVPDPAGSWFFIMYKTAPRLDGGCAASNRLIEGEDVLDRITITKANVADKPLKDQKIKTVAVEILGETYPKPGKLSEIGY